MLRVCRANSERKKKDVYFFDNSEVHPVFQTLYLSVLLCLSSHPTVPDRRLCSDNCFFQQKSWKRKNFDEKVFCARVFLGDSLTFSAYFDIYRYIFLKIRNGSCCGIGKRVSCCCISDLWSSSSQKEEYG